MGGVGKVADNLPCVGIYFIPICVLYYFNYIHTFHHHCYVNTQVITPCLLITN